MLIRKGGIYRDIDENKLQEYKDKGYEVVKKSSEGSQSGEKPLSKMNTAELEAKAKELGVDITGCKNNGEKAAKIQEFITANQ